MCTEDCLLNRNSMYWSRRTGIVEMRQANDPERGQLLQFQVVFPFDQPQDLYH
jgi:hypothetical protein